jgi:hypothetical protein
MRVIQIILMTIERYIHNPRNINHSIIECCTVSAYKPREGRLWFHSLLYHEHVEELLPVWSDDSHGCLVSKLFDQGTGPVKVTSCC